MLNRCIREKYIQSSTKIKELQMKLGGGKVKISSSRNVSSGSETLNANNLNVFKGRSEKKKLKGNLIQDYHCEVSNL